MFLAQAKGFEPLSSVLETDILPLNYTCICEAFILLFQFPPHAVARFNPLVC